MFDLQTADENWNPSLLDESSRLFFKVRSSANVVFKCFPLNLNTPVCQKWIKSLHVLQQMDAVFGGGDNSNLIMQDCRVNSSAENEETIFYLCWGFDYLYFWCYQLALTHCSLCFHLYSWFDWTTCLHIGTSTQSSSPSTVQMKRWWVTLHQRFWWKSRVKLCYLFEENMCLCQ